MTTIEKLSDDRTEEVAEHTPAAPVMNSSFLKVLRNRPHDYHRKTV